MSIKLSRDIPADLPKDLTRALTVELSGNQDYAKAAGVMGLGFGYATTGGVYGAPAAALGNFGSAYGNLGMGGYLLPTAALFGTGTLEGTNRYSGPLLAGCAPYGLLPGYAQPWAGTYGTYRIMSAHPTLVLAGAAVMGPILASSWSFEQNQKKAPKEAKAFIADLLEPLRPRLLLECLKALVFGWRGFEKVYALRDGYLTLDKLKPLLPELTSILITDKGHLAGLTQADAEAAPDGIQIPAEKVFVYTYDRDGDNHYGRSRHENCRRQWSNWLMDEDNLGRLGSKVSSIIPQIGYPPGDGIDSQGNLQSNFQLALQLASGLASGRPITMPNLASLTIDDLTRLPQLAQGSLWSIKTIDMGNPGPAQEALLKQLQYRDALLVRGWLRPERSLLESQRGGSRADSQVHADLGLTDCQLVHADIAEAINRQIIDPLLAYNFGESARGSVYIKPAAASDDQQILDQEMLRAIAANPQLLPELIAHLDMDAWLDRSGLPRNQLAGEWDGRVGAGTLQNPSDNGPRTLRLSGGAGDPTVRPSGNPYHDEQGRFTSADNAVGAGDDARESKHPASTVQPSTQASGHSLATATYVKSLLKTRQNDMEELAELSLNREFPGNADRIETLKAEIATIERILEHLQPGMMAGVRQAEAAVAAGSFDPDAANRADLIDWIGGHLFELEHDLDPDEDFNRERVDIANLKTLRTLVEDATDIGVSAKGQPYARTAAGQQMLDAYEARQARQLEILQMGAGGRLREVFGLLLKSDKVSKAYKERIKALLDPANWKIFLAVASLAAAAQFTPAAPLVDLVGLLLTGAEGLNVAGKFAEGVADVIEARTDEDLDHAADELADGLSRAGMDAAQAVAGYGAGKAIAKSAKSVREILAERKVAKEAETIARARRQAWRDGKIPDDYAPGDSPHKSEAEPQPKASSGKDQAQADSASASPRTARPRIGNEINRGTEGVVYHDLDEPGWVVKEFDQGRTSPLQARNEFANLAKARAVHPDNVVKAREPADPRQGWIVKERVIEDPQPTDHTEGIRILHDFVLGGVNDAEGNMMYGHTASNPTPRWILVE